MYLYSLSTWLHQRFSYCLKTTNCSFHRILIAEMHHSKEVQALSIAFLIDILLREQCKASGGYWHKLKLEGTDIGKIKKHVLKKIVMLNAWYS